MNNQKKNWIRRFIWITLAATILFFSARGYYRLTDDFRVANITYELPFNPEWQTEPLSLPEREKIESILSQPFYYLGKGAQSYAFISQDKKNVIKFFKFKHLKPNFVVSSLPDISFFSEYKEKKSARKKRLIKSVFNGYKLAYDLHKEESGLVFIHLNQGGGFNQKLTLFDKIGRKHELDLDKTVFVLQQTAVTTRDVIDQALASGNVDLVNKRMDQIIDLYMLEYQKGIYDRDHGLMHNTGFVDGQPVHLDVGKLSWEPNMKKEEYYIRDLKIVEARFGNWIKNHYPEHYDRILSHFKKKVSEVAGKKFGNIENPD